GKKEYQESIPEPPAFHPSGNVLLSGKTEAPSQKTKQLSSAAVAVAVSLRTPDHRNNQRNKKAQQAQPGEQDIEKSKNQIGQRSEPQIIIPLTLHALSPSGS